VAPKVATFLVGRGTLAGVRPGPPPTPTSLRLLKGDPPYRVNKREPRPRDATPRPPAWLTPEARAIWRRTLRELEPMKVMTSADSNALGLYCVALAEFVQAQQLVARDGLVVKGRDGGTVANPAARIERDRWAMVWRAGAEFGLTPSARVSLGTVPEYEPNELERLLTQ
jgi:P27 family predicted phage terminase small subunit